MDIYKDFIQSLRRKQFEETYILLSEDTTEKMKEYILLLRDVKFEDGSYHTYYGDVKRIVASFLVYFASTVDEVIVTADKYINVSTKDDLLWLITRTISTHQESQVLFGNSFLPVKSDVEKKVYEEVESEYIEYIKKLYDLKEKVEKFDKKDQIDEFAKENIGRAVAKTSDLLNFVQDFIGMMLADSFNCTRTSLEEIHLRMWNNLRRVQQEHEDNVNSLLLQLYDKNKESLVVGRCDRKCSMEIAEVNRGIKKIRTRLANFETEVPMARLQEEVAYWRKRLEEFNEVAHNLFKLKSEQENVIREEKIYNSLKSRELPGEKFECWKNMGVNFANKRKYLKKTILQEAKSLLTFYAVRGTDRIFYTNDIGPYYVDEFNHQVYVFDYGLAVYHVDCEGDFKQFPEHPYYFDKCGRYVNLDGEKIYQAGQCNSQYKLGDGEMLNKITEDCGHSERNNALCEMQIVDPTVREILPDSKPIDIKRTLDHDTVQYLWDSFGGLLPEALFDVGMARPRNPIHFLAHKLLYHKYRRTKTEIQEKAKEAELFRAGVFQKRKEEAKASTLKWRSKLVQRRTPEESDDAQDRAVYDAQMAQQMFIHALNFQDYS